MEEKNVKPGVTIIIAIICVLLVGSLCFWLGKQFSNKENEKEKENEKQTWVEKNKAMSLTWLDGDLVILTTDGKEIKKSVDIGDGNTSVFYTDEKIYTFAYGTEETGSILGYLDVNDDFKFTKLSSFSHETIPESIIVYKEHAYISLAGKKYIIDYDLKEKKETKLYYFDDYFSKIGYGSFLIYCVNDQVYYLTRGAVDLDPEFGTIDLETGKKEKIDVTGYVNYIYDGKFVFNRDYYQGNKYMTQYYEYNTKTKEVNKISGAHLDGGAGADYSFMIPFDDYYIYVTGDKAIYKFENGKDTKLKDIDMESFNVFKVSDNEILILEGGFCETDDCDFKQYIYNVKDNTIKEDGEATKYYSSIIYLK